MSKTLIALIFTSTLTTFAQASDITIVCDVQQTADGQSQSSFKRRDEIDLEPRYFRTSIDTGKGFRRSEEGFPADLSASRIVFVDDGTVTQYYDRDKREYVYQNVATNVEASGKCVEHTTPLQPDAVKPLPARE